LKPNSGVWKSGSDVGEHVQQDRGLAQGLVKPALGFAFAQGQAVREKLDCWYRVVRFWPKWPLAIHPSGNHYDIELIGHRMAIVLDAEGSIGIDWKILDLEISDGQAGARLFNLITQRVLHGAPLIVGRYPKSPGECRNRDRGEKCHEAIVPIHPINRPDNASAESRYELTQHNQRKDDYLEYEHNLFGILLTAVGVLLCMVAVALAASDLRTPSHQVGDTPR
jgi:hypothetical protein